MQPAGCGAAELSAGRRLSKRARLHQTVALGFQALSLQHIQPPTLSSVSLDFTASSKVEIYIIHASISQATLFLFRFLK